MSLPVTSKEENSKPVYLTCMPKYIYFIVFFLNTASVQNAQWCGKKIKWNQFQDWPWWVRIVTVTDMKNNYNNYMERASAFSDDLVWLYRSYESVLNRDCFASSSKFLAVHLTLSFLCWNLTNVIIVRSVNILEKKKKKKGYFEVHWTTFSSCQYQIRKHIQSILFYIFEAAAGIIFLNLFLPKLWKWIVSYAFKNYVSQAGHTGYVSSVCA